MGDYDGEERRREMKKATKEAIKEWLDQQFALFGKWSLAAIASLALAGLVYFILWVNGWYRG